MVISPRMRSDIDDLKSMGKSTLDIVDMVNTDTQKKRGSTVEQLSKSYSDSEFNEIRLPDRHKKNAICNVCGGSLVNSRESGDSNRILLCTICGRKTNPMITPMQYATRMQTVTGEQRRKGPSSKMTHVSGEAQRIFVEEDNINRNIYASGNSHIEKRFSVIGEDKEMEKLSGVSITGVTETRPQGDSKINAKLIFGHQ